MEMTKYTYYHLAIVTNRVGRHLLRFKSNEKRRFITCRDDVHIGTGKACLSFSIICFYHHCL